MEQVNRCDHCRSIISRTFVCDTCGEYVNSDSLSLTLNGEYYHFCMYQCLFSFIIAEIRKNSPNNNASSEEQL